MIISGIVGVSSLLLYFFLPDLLTSLIKSQLVLRDGDESILLQMWRKPPVAANVAYYFYHFYNPDEVLRGHKARVETVGPYCFKQWRTKKIVGWSPDGETVRYLEYKNHIFAPEVEGCKPNMDDKLTVINPPVAALGGTLADIIREKLPIRSVTSPIIMATMSAFLSVHRQRMFMTRSVKEIVLGFRVNLLDTVTTLIKPLELVGIRKEDLLPGGGAPNNTFGLMYGRNNTPEGPYEVYTGKNPNYRFLHLTKWKGKTSLEWWKSQYCNQIHGSDGTMFGAGVKRTDKLWAFAADICRSIYITYQRDGIPTYVFGIDDTLFGSENIEPNNKCFCVHSGPEVEHRCKINGIFDLGGCQGGAPLIVSKPQFLSTDPDLSLDVENFEPNKKDHDSVVEIEPLTGIAVNGLKKLQFSLRVENVPYLSGFNYMKNVTYIPFAIGAESGGLPDDLADMLRNFVFNPIKYFNWILLATSVIAFFLFGRSAFRRLLANRRARESVKKISDGAKNLYKKRNAIESEVSSIKSTTDLVPRINDNENYANTTNVKLHLKNNGHQSNRFQRLSASALYANGQQMMNSYLPQIIPIIMPLTYSMNQNETREHERNRERSDEMNQYNAPMITNISSSNSKSNHTSRRTSNMNNTLLPYNLISFNYSIPLNRNQTRLNSVHPVNEEELLETLSRKISENHQSYFNQLNQNSNSDFSSRRTSINQKLNTNHNTINNDDNNNNDNNNDNTYYYNENNDNNNNSNNNDNNNNSNNNNSNNNSNNNNSNNNSNNNNSNNDDNLSEADLSSLSSDENLNNFDIGKFENTTTDTRHLDKYYLWGVKQGSNSKQLSDDLNNNQIDKQNDGLNENLESGHDQNRNSNDENEFNAMYKNYRQTKKFTINN